MRIFLIVVSIVLVLLTSLGAAIWWITEPMRFAGIDRGVQGMRTRGGRRRGLRLTAGIDARGVGRASVTRHRARRRRCDHALLARPGVLKAGDLANALSDFEAAVRLDPSHFESSRNLDYIYAQRGDWPRVISMWNNYLAGNPDDGRAIFERAGAYRRSGNQEQAMTDARKACELGVQPACAVVGR